MMPTYTPQELDYFGLSPKDNAADYDPLEYIAVIKSTMDAGKLGDYTLSELQKVEKQFSQAYSSLSDEQIKKYEEAIYLTQDGIISLQNEKEDQDKEFIQKTVSFLDDLIDSYDAELPENRSRKYLGAVEKDIAAGKLSGYSLAELQEVEERLKEAYSSLSEDDKEFYLERCSDAAMALADLQIDTPEPSLAGLLEDYFSGDKQAWEGFKPGNYKRRESDVFVEEEDISAEELAELMDLEDEADNKVENLIANLPVIPPEEASPGAYRVRQRTLRSLGNDHYKAALVVSPKKVKIAVSGFEDTILDLSEGFADINYVSGFEDTQMDLSSKVSEMVSAAISKPETRNRKKSGLSYFAKASLAAAGVISLIGVSLAGYSGLYSAIDTAADKPLKNNHGTPAAEAAAPISKAKHDTGKSNSASETKSAGASNVSSSVPKNASRPGKIVMDLPRDYHPYDDNVYFVQKGDTFVGLWEDYKARGGVLSFPDYLRSVRAANPQISDLNKIYPGQEVELP